MVNRTSLYPVYEQDIQDVQDVQDEEACGSRSVSLVMKPLILAILSVLAILLGFLSSAVSNRSYRATGHSMEKVEIVNDNFGLRRGELHEVLALSFALRLTEKRLREL